MEKRADLSAQPRPDNDVTPTVRRVQFPSATKFSASVSQKRPELDSEPPPGWSGSESTYPPEDFPEPDAPTQVDGPHSSAHRSAPHGSSQPPHSTPAPSAEGWALRRAQSQGPAEPKRGLSRFIGPLGFVAAAAGAFVLSSTLLETGRAYVGPRAPKIPDLGSLPAPQAGRLEGPSLSAVTPQTPLAAPAQDPIQSFEPLATPETPRDGVPFPGKGLVEVVTSEPDLVYLDGVFVGRGPLRRIPIEPGQHEIVLRSGGKERPATIEVRAGQLTRIVFPGAVRVPGEDTDEDAPGGTEEPSRP